MDGCGVKEGRDVGRFFDFVEPAPRQRWKWKRKRKAPPSPPVVVRCSHRLREITRDEKASGEEGVSDQVWRGFCVSFDHLIRSVTKWARPSPDDSHR